ncbi:MAG: endonuclease III, partial [Phycisphaerae bacterium]|nr:endonuclease III [Phycisphaerae bacterium]
LMEIVAKTRWTKFSDLLIFHGRNICKARKPDCENCPVSVYCPASNNPKLW